MEHKMSAEKNLYSSCIELFLRVITSGDNSMEAAGAAVFSVSEPLHIARAEGMMDVSVLPYEKKAKHLHVTLFENRTRKAYEPYSFDFVTNEPGSGSFVFYCSKEKGFSSAEKHVLDSLGSILQMYLGKLRMIQMMEKSSRTQIMTGLPNSNGYLREVAKYFADGRINCYDAYYFNLKGFGLVNRRFGQKEGNEIMKRYVRTLQNFFKDDELLGHLGGDNFVALVRKGRRRREFLNLLSGTEVYGMHGHVKEPVMIRAAAGIMTVKMPCLLDMIIDGPSIALVHAKRTRKPYVLYTEELNDQITRGKTVEQRFESALAKGEFAVFYQPKVNTVSGEIIGAEALTRWMEHGSPIPPGMFIPILEQSEKITRLDLAMMKTVCRDLAAWKGTGRQTVPVSVNFSRRDLSDPDLPEKILDIISSHQVDKKDIIVEVTETTNEEEKEQMTSFLTRLRRYGIKTSIDDFGTGYSSLSVLREFPVSEIKIDRSFINRNLDATDEIIIRSIIELAEKLKVDVITEGVETVVQRDFLHQVGCDRVQGFLYDRPLPKDSFESRLLSGSYQIDRKTDE